MKKNLAIGTALVAAAAVGALAVSYSGAQPRPAAPPEARPATSDETSARVSTSFTAAQEQDIEALVRAYLLDNPEIILESLQLYQQREQLAVQERYIEGTRRNLAALTDDRDGFGAGADLSEAKVAVIEFFDYHCGYCKRATGLVQDLTQADPQVRIFFREFPILRAESEVAAEYALAARKQNKYADFHFALMETPGVLTEKRIKNIARQNGLNVAQLEKDRKSAAVRQALRKTDQIAEDMGVDGTPSFIVTTLDGSFVEVFPGYDAERLLAAIEKAKEVAG